MPGSLKIIYLDLVNKADGEDRDLLLLLKIHQAVGSDEIRKALQEYSDYCGDVHGYQNQDLKLQYNGLRGVWWNHTDKIDDQDTIDLKALAGAKYTSLTNTVTIKAGIAAKTDAAVADFTTYTTTNPGNSVQKKAALVVLNNAQPLGADPNTLTDAEADALDVIVRAKQLSLTNTVTIKAGIAAKTDAAVADFTTYTTTNPGNSVQKKAALVVLNNAQPLGADPNTLTDAEADALDVIVRAKQLSLTNTVMIKAGIAAKTDAAVADFTTYTTTNPGNSVQKKAALVVLNNAQPLGADPNTLTDAEADALDVIVRAKQLSLTNTVTIKAGIAAKTDAAVADFTTYTTTNPGNSVQKKAALVVLNNAQPLGADPNTLTDAEADALDVIVRAKQLSLTNTVTIKAGIAAKTDAAVADFTTYTTTNPGNSVQKKAALVVLNNAQPLGADPNTLTDAEADALDVIVRAKQLSLTNTVTIKAGIAAKTDAAVADFTTYTTTNPGNSVQKKAALVVLNNAQPLGADPNTLTDAEADALDVIVRAKQLSLTNTVMIKAGIAAKTDAAVADFTTYTTTNPGNSVQKKAALVVLNNAQPLGADPNTLTDAEADALDVIVRAKQLSLTNTVMIKAGIAAKTDAAVADFTTYTTTNPGNSVQKKAALVVLNNAQPLGADPNTLTDAEADALDVIVRAKQLSLTNTKKYTDIIQAMTGYDLNTQIDMLNILKTIKNAPDEDGVRRALSNKAGFGTDILGRALAVGDLLNEDANAIKSIATQKYNSLILEHRIRKINDPGKLQRIIDLPRPINHDNLRQELRTLANEGLNLSYHITLDNQDKLSNLEAERILQLVIDRRDVIQREPIIANFVMQEGEGRLPYFSDELVKKGAPEPVKVLSTEVNNGLALNGVNPVDTSYRGKQLHEGDKIYSIANFPVETNRPNGHNNEAAQAVLTQDHKGKVTDVTKSTEREKLTEREKVLLALKQARMYLTNLKDTKKEQTIIISGDDAEQAKKVYAALLLLKGGVKVKIDSYVVGFDVPKKGKLELKSSFEEKNIKTFLPKNVISDALLQAEKKEISEFIKNTRERREQIASLKAQSGTAAKLQAKDKEIEVDNVVSGIGNKI